MKAKDEQTKRGPQQKEGHVFDACVTLLTARETNQPSGRLSIKHLEVFVSFMKVMVWPALILILFLWLRGPITKTVEVLPERISKSTKLTVWNLSIEIQQAAQNSGHPELAEIIGELSPRAIETLLRIAKDKHGLVATGDGQSVYFLPTSEEMDALLELERKGLLRFELPPQDFNNFAQRLPWEINQQTGEYRPTRPLTQAEKEKLLQQQYYLTDIGRTTFDLIIQVAAQEFHNPASGAK